MKVDQLLLPILLCSIALTPVIGQDCTNQQVIPATSASGDMVGSSVDIHNHTAVIGAPNANGTKGGAYVYMRSGEWWAEQATLLPITLGTGDEFGSAVAIDGDTIVVGAPMMQGIGGCFVFERESDGSWSEEFLYPPVGAPYYNSYGRSVDVSEDMIVVGAVEIVTGGLVRDVVYVFEKTTAGLQTQWSPVTTITPSDGAPTLFSSPDQFGHAVSLDARGNGLDPVLIVGAPIQDLLTGSAYVFEKIAGTWIEVSKLQPSVPLPFARFGHAVSISGTVAAVGAPMVPSGTVDIFQDTGSGWVLDTAINDPDGGIGDWFGWDIHLQGNILAIGAMSDDQADVDAGATYIFEEQGTSNWVQLSKEMPSSSGEGFGSSVAVTDTTCMAGASDLGGGTGSAWLTMLPGHSCPTLTIDRGTLSASEGDTVTFTLTTDNTSYMGNPNILYWIVGSSSGTSPGFPFQGFQIPLNQDAYTNFTLNSPGQVPLDSFVGMFDSTGNATASINLARGSSSSLVGLALDHVFGVFDVPSGQVLEVSNLAGTIRIVP